MTTFNWLRALSNSLAMDRNRAITRLPSLRSATKPPLLIRPIQRLDDRITPDITPLNLAVSNFYQNWNATTLITANDDWSGVPSVVGYLGDDMARRIKCATYDLDALRLIIV